MRVLLITPFYTPDLGPSAPLYTMLCEDLVHLGCQVSVIAAVPHYPSGTVSPEFRGHPTQRERQNGVDVTRVWVPSVNRARLGQRLLTFVSYQFLATFVGLRRHYDVLIASNPALEAGLPFLVLGALRRKPAVFSVQDIYPDVGVKLGVFKYRPIIRAIDIMERFCLDQAGYVQVISEGFRQSLRAKGLPNSKLVVIPNWIDTDFIQPMSHANEFSTHWGLSDAFVVIYAGNIGLSQGLEHVVEATRLLAKEPSIRFVFVGDGAGKDGLQEAARSSGLSNIQFTPFQPRELLPQVLASADVSLITLKRGVGADSVPSKCYSILASGRPVIAAVDQGSDTWNLIHQANCGLCVEPENPQALADAILQLYRDEDYRAELGANGRTYVVQHHSRMAAARAFHQLLCSIASERQSSPKEAETHG